MCSHLCTYSHRYSFFVQGVTHSHKKLNVVSVFFFSDSFVVYSCSCHVLLAEALLSERILQFVISCYIYITRCFIMIVYRIVRETGELYLLY